MDKTYVIINSKNKLFKYKAENTSDALNSYIESTLGFNIRFSMAKEEWLAISNLIESINTKIDLFNGLCKRANDKINKIFLESFAYPFESGGVNYEISEDFTHAIVTGCDKNCTKIRVAQEYDGIPVTKIKEAAFKNNINITEIVLPNSIQVIEKDAFDGCSSLTILIFIGTELEFGSIQNYAKLTAELVTLKPELIPEEKVLIFTARNKLYEYPATSIREVLTNHITTVLGFGRRFEITADRWAELSNLEKSKPISVKIELINGLCRFSSDKLSKILVGSYIYPEVIV